MRISMLGNQNNSCRVTVKPRNYVNYRILDAAKLVISDDSINQRIVPMFFIRRRNRCQMRWFVNNQKISILINFCFFQMIFLVLINFPFRKLILKRSLPIVRVFSYLYFSSLLQKYTKNLLIAWILSHLLCIMSLSE